MFGSLTRQRFGRGIGHKFSKKYYWWGKPTKKIKSVKFSKSRSYSATKNDIIV